MSLNAGNTLVMAYGYAGGVDKADPGTLAHQDNPEEEKHRHRLPAHDFYKTVVGKDPGKLPP